MRRKLILRAIPTAEGTAWVAEIYSVPSEPVMPGLVSAYSIEVVDRDRPALLEALGAVDRDTPSGFEAAQRAEAQQLDEECGRMSRELAAMTAERDVLRGKLAASEVLRNAGPVARRRCACPEETALEVNANGRITRNGEWFMYPEKERVVTCGVCLCVVSADAPESAPASPPGQGEERVVEWHSPREGTWPGGWVSVSPSGWVVATGSWSFLEDRSPPQVSKIIVSGPETGEAAKPLAEAAVRAYLADTAEALAEVVSAMPEYKAPEPTYSIVVDWSPGRDSCVVTSIRREVDGTRTILATAELVTCLRRDADGTLTVRAYLADTAEALVNPRRYETTGHCVSHQRATPRVALDEEPPPEVPALCAQLDEMADTLREVFHSLPTLPTSHVDEARRGTLQVPRESDAPPPDAPGGSEQ